MGHANYSKMMMRDALRTSWYLFQRARDESRDWAKKAKQPMSRALIRRFIEWQAQLLCPICPHWAEYVWSLLPGTSGSITQAGWPAAEPVDQVLRRSYDFMRETLATTCQTIGKAKPDEKHGVIYVISTLPQWKISCLRWMKEQYVANNNSLPYDMINKMKDWVASDPALKKETKNLMQFASFTKR